MTTLFCIIFFLGFFLPNNTTPFIPVFGAQVEPREIALILLPILNLLIKRKPYRIHNSIRLISIATLLSIIASETIKTLYFNNSPYNALASLRYSLPTISFLFILSTGLNAMIGKIWKTTCLIIISSTSLSVVFAATAPLLPPNFLSPNLGRIDNSNLSFCVLALSIVILPQKPNFSKNNLTSTALLLSLITLILSFSRTYIIISIIGMFAILTLKPNLNFTIKLLASTIIATCTLLIVTSSSEVISNQFQKRFINFSSQGSDLSESTTVTGRILIYQQSIEHIRNGFWKMGLPSDKPIFSYTLYGEEHQLMVTDTSFLTTLLRYGVLPTVLLIITYFLLYKNSASTQFKFALILYVLASLNIDSLFRHNSVIFLLILFYATTKNSLTSVKTRQYNPKILNSINRSVLTKTNEPPTSF